MLYINVKCRICGKEGRTFSHGIYRGLCASCVYSKSNQFERPIWYLHDHKLPTMKNLVKLIDEKKYKEVNKQAKVLSNHPQFAVETAIIMAKHELTFGDTRSASHYYLDAKSRCKSLIELIYRAGVACYYFGLYTEAIKRFERLIRLIEDDSNGNLDYFVLIKSARRFLRLIDEKEAEIFSFDSKDDDGPDDAYAEIMLRAPQIKPN